MSEEERETWADLAARYRWSYGLSLQQRLALAPVRADIMRWWRVGGKPKTGNQAPQTGNQA